MAHPLGDVGDRDAVGEAVRGEEVTDALDHHAVGDVDLACALDALPLVLEVIGEVRLGAVHGVVEEVAVDRAVFDPKETA
ncbi:hypothetical protein Sros01_02770 [Streptomyces roseochromogenus]|nr:hypothetical protein Sros01_02770 [Streptomyces roseochromogenus]